MRVTHPTLFLLTLWLAASLFAQQTPQKTNQPITTIRSQSELVLVPVVVTDKKGNPVTGVPREYFSIFEDGKPKKIAVFNEVHTSPRLIQPPSPSATDFTNTMGSDQNTRITIIMLDMLNTEFSGQVRVRRETLNFLSQHLEPGEPVALLSLGREGLRVLHDFTTDPQVLAKALESMRPGMSAQEKRGIETVPVTPLPIVRQALEGFIEGPESMSPVRIPLGLYGYSGYRQYQMYAAQRVFDIDSAYQATLQSLRIIADAFASLPGRKTLIWATGGIPNIADMPNAALVSRTDYRQYQATWAALSSANIAVYPLDLSSLVNAYYRSSAYAYTGRPQSLTNVTNLEEFARVTGGRLCIAKLDMENCFRTAAQDASSYYELAYYTDAKGKDGWRHISVKLTPGVLKVQARSGFFYRAKSMKDSSRDDDLKLATTSPIDLSAIPLRVRWDSQAAKDKKIQVPFELSFPASAITVLPDDKNHLQVELFALPKTPDGKPQPGFSQTLAGDVPEAQLNEFLNQEVTRQGSLELAPGDYEVRFIVRDSLSGKVGTVTAPLTVRKQP